MQVLGQGKDVARFKSSLPKAYYSSFYFQVLPLSPFSSLSQLNVHFPYSIPSHSILFSYFSNSPVLHCFCNESSLHIRGATAIRIDSSPSWGFLITRHMQNFNLAYINLATGSSYTKPSPRHPRAQHTFNPTTFQPRGYTLLPPSLHSQCASSHSRNRIAKLRLTGVCGQYYKVSPHTVQQRYGP